MNFFRKLDIWESFNFPFNSIIHSCHEFEIHTFYSPNNPNLIIFVCTTQLNFLFSTII